MKIAVDVAQSCVERAGCASFAVSLAQAFLRVRPGSPWIWYHHFGDWINTDTAAGVLPPPGGTVEMPFLGMTTAQARSAWHEIETGTRIAPGSPDVVQSTSFHAPRIPGSRLVVMVHDVAFWLHPEFTTGLNRLVCQRETLRALERASALVFPSKSSRADFDAVLPGWLESSGVAHAVIPHASRFAPRPPQSPEVDAPWLAVGNLEPRKNHATLLRAYASYAGRARRPRRLDIVGGAGWLSEDVRTSAANWGGPGTVRLSGYVSDTGLECAYRGAFAVLVPSWHEGFGLPVVEALSQSVPVITSESAALLEIADDAGLHAPAADAGLLAAEMLRLDQSPELRRELAENAHRRGGHFSWDATARRYLAFYDEVVARLPRDAATAPAL